MCTITAQRLKVILVTLLIDLCVEQEEVMQETIH